MNYEAVVIGASAGGMEALKKLLAVLPKSFGAPIVIVQHLSPHSDNYLARRLNELCKIHVKEADEKEKITAGTAYIAPPNYHLLIEQDKTMSLSADRKVNFSRPSIDVLFDSAAEVFRKGLIGVILTGANNDGSKGLKNIRKFGGLAIVQEPGSAETSAMPRAAIEAAGADFILTIDQISNKLIELIGDKHE
jgi:two-component system chemotaxis response regulator CheB